MEWLKKKWPIAVITLIVLVPIFLLIRIILQGWYLNTPQISGKAVDEETGKPIKNARFKVTWYVGTISSGAAYKEIYVEANNEGKFTIPAERKWLHLLTPNDDQWIVVYAHGYRGQRITRERDGRIIQNPKNSLLGNELSSTQTIIKLKPLKTEQEWQENIERLEGTPFNANDEVPQGINFLVEECELFIKTFPNSQLAPSILLKSADIYYGILINHPEYNEIAIKQYNKVIKRFPQSDEARIADQYIQYIKDDLSK